MTEALGKRLLSLSVTPGKYPYSAVKKRRKRKRRKQTLTLALLSTPGDVVSQPYMDWSRGLGM